MSTASTRRWSSVDTIGEAFALIGAGMLAFAAAALHGHPGQRAWAGYTVALALLMLVTAASYAAGSGSLTDLLLFAGGVVVLPLWLIRTARAARAVSGEWG